MHLKYSQHSKLYFHSFVVVMATDCHAAPFSGPICYITDNNLFNLNNADVFNNATCYHRNRRISDVTGLQACREHGLVQCWKPVMWKPHDRKLCCGLCCWYGVRRHSFIHWRLTDRKLVGRALPSRGKGREFNSRLTEPLTYKIFTCT